MADVFEDNSSIEAEREKLWALIAETPMLDWLLLTKRPENMMRFAPWQDSWPPNIWAMTSVENQDQAEKRIPKLLTVPAVVRGLSVEPLLGPVDLEQWLANIQWVIVGGESGPNARPMHPNWARSVRDQCQAAGVAFFFKQWGNWSPSGDERTRTFVFQTDAPYGTTILYNVGKHSAGRLLDDRTWDEFPLTLEESMNATHYLPHPIVTFNALWRGIFSGIWRSARLETP